MRQSHVDVKALVAAFFRHRGGHYRREPPAAPVNLSATDDAEAEPRQPRVVVDHLREASTVQLSGIDVRCVCLQQQLSDVVGLDRIDVDEVAEERPLGSLDVQL